MSMRYPRQHVICLVLVCLLAAIAQHGSQSGWSVWADDQRPSTGGIADIYRRVSPSVVSIEVEIGLFDDASGTGFIVDAHGHIVTNAHVVEDALHTTVVFQDGAKASAVLVGMDRSVDIAVLKVNTSAFRLKPVSFGDSDDLAIGLSVLAIGNPFGLEATLTTGIISGLKREIEFYDGSILAGMIQTDAAIAPGSSGGPLLSLYGEVIGVNSAGYGGRYGGTNFGFAIPSNTVKRIAGRMIARGISLATSLPTAKPLPPNTATETMQPTLTRIPPLTVTPTAIVQREFEATLTALPTLDETEVARFLATPPAQVGLRDLPPSLTPTRFQPTVAVRAELIQPTIALVSVAPTFSRGSASAYQFNVGPGQIFTFQNIQLGDGVRLFFPNPVDSNSWIRTDHVGILRYKPLGVPQEGVMSVSPFYEGFGVSSIDQNKYRIVELDWSADGQQFSFRIAPPGGTDTANAGVWFWQPRIETQYDPTYPIIRDCPNPGYKSCSLVRPSNAGHWQTRAVSWSPVRGSNAVLLTVHLPDERRNALAIAQAVREQSASQARQAPDFERYDYGHWNPDGQSIIVSGRRPDGRVIIGEVNSDLSGERVLLDASALGLWLRDAVRRPNGQIVSLGRPGAPGSGPVALYDGRGSQISGFIGGAAPEDVRWFPDRSVVVVSVQGRQYAVQVEGGIVTDVTDQLSDPQFSASSFASAAIPAGVVEGQAYTPGQQLRTVIPLLNMRQSPSTLGLIFGQLVEGDYVAILAGPHRSEGYPWWQVQSADGIVGWIVGEINGLPTIRAP